MVQASQIQQVFDNDTKKLLFEKDLRLLFTGAMI